MIPKLAVLLGFSVCALLPFVVGASVSQNDDVSTFADVIKSRSVRSTCGYDSCNRFCRSLGHARGVCIGTYCQCRFRRRRAADDSQDLENVRVDEVKASSGPQANDEEPSESHSDVSPFADVIKSRSVRSTCTYDSCNRYCRSIGQARGVCISNYCQCRFRRRRAADDAQNLEKITLDIANEKAAVTENEPAQIHSAESHGFFSDIILSRSRRSCGAGECNAHCKKLGHARGVCIGTYCQCRSRLRRSLDHVDENDTKTVESSPVTNKDESEVSSGTFADVILSRSRRSCGAGECNAHCKKLGHARGVCIGTYCQCRSRLCRSLDDTDGTGA